jgi:hypothetical protein
LLLLLLLLLLQYCEWRGIGLRFICKIELDTRATAHLNDVRRDKFAYHATIINLVLRVLVMVFQGFKKFSGWSMPLEPPSNGHPPSGKPAPPINLARSE